MTTYSVRPAVSADAWDAFLSKQQFRPFLQSWTMGDVYAQIDQPAVRLEALDAQGEIAAIAFAHLVPARRGRHLSVPYGPVGNPNAFPALFEALAEDARHLQCSFVRVSPHLPRGTTLSTGKLKAVRSPLHLLGEEIWYLPLHTPNNWTNDGPSQPRQAEEILMQCRKTTRNLIRRAEKDGVTIEAAQYPDIGLKEFIRLHDETRKRHGFTPYGNRFFRAQVECFAKKGQVTVYLAHYQNEVIAASVHMHAYGETSYHHGASSAAHSKVPASYLLQWRAIEDALKRGDRVYNFWGIAPTHLDEEGERRLLDKNHPFAGVTTFKTGFGGELLPLIHCFDIPLTPMYQLTRAFELLRKWKRGF